MPEMREQIKGMDHVRYLKRLAIEMWKEVDMVPQLWIDCLNCVLIQHCIQMKRLKENQDLIEREKLFQDGSFME